MDDDNGKCNTSSIENSSIGAIFHGDAEVQNLVLHLGSQPTQEEESREELVEALEARRDLLKRTRFRNSILSGGLAICMLVVMSYLARHTPLKGGMPELIGIIMVFAAIPAGLWMIVPQEWRDHMRTSKRRIKILTAQIEQLENRIGHLEINELSARRRSRR